MANRFESFDHELDSRKERRSATEELAPIDIAHSPDLRLTAHEAAQIAHSGNRPALRPDAYEPVDDWRPIDSEEPPDVTAPDWDAMYADHGRASRAVMGSEPAQADADWEALLERLIEQGRSFHEQLLSSGRRPARRSPFSGKS